MMNSVVRASVGGRGRSAAHALTHTGVLPHPSAGTLGRAVRVCVAAALLVVAYPAWAAETIGSASEVSGAVKLVRGAGGAERTPAMAGSQVYEGDTIETGPDGRLKILFKDDSVLSLAQNTTLRIDRHLLKPEEDKRQGSFSLIKGSVLSLVGRVFRNNESKFEVKTATAVAGVRGTYFSVSVSGDADAKKAITEVVVIEGEVDVTRFGDTKPVTLKAGMEIGVGATDFIFAPRVITPERQSQTLQLGKVDPPVRPGDDPKGTYGFDGMSEQQLGAVANGEIGTDASREVGAGRRNAGRESLSRVGGGEESDRRGVGTMRVGNDFVQRTADETLQAAGGGRPSNVGVNINLN